MMLIRTGRRTRPGEAEPEPRHQVVPPLVQEAPPELTAAPTLEQTVRARREAGQSQRAIAREFNIDRRKVKRILDQLIHSVSRCQSWGRCRMIWPRPWQAIRAATLMRSRRKVAPLALAQARLARDPAARSRLWAMAAQASQAAFAGNEPERAGGPGAPSARSANTCST